MTNQAKKFSVVDLQNELFIRLSRTKQQALADNAQSIHGQCSPYLQHAIDCAQEKNASSWLTALPIEHHGFTLHKRAFVDALCLRYGWVPPQLSSQCICSQEFSTTHAFSCSHGTFLIFHHNDIHDLTASLLSEVEPPLQSLTSEALQYRTAVYDDDAHLDIEVSDF